jgi:hypothetical protein
MRPWQVGASAGLLLVLGCGGKSERDGTSAGPDASGGAGGFDAGTGGAAGAALDAGGAGGAGGAGAPADAGPALCSARPLGCDTSAQYVDISDTQTLRLAYPADPSCGACDRTCQLFASGSSGCGNFDLSLAACSAPNGGGACLDTASTERSYTDASGKRWTTLGFGGSSAQLKGEQAEGVVDLDLTLLLSDNATTRELPVHAHVCASIVPSGSLVVCK